MPSAEGRIDEVKQLQGTWSDAAGNTWTVKDYKAVVGLSGGGSQSHFLSVLPAGRVGLLDARVTRIEQRGLQWSDGDRWVRTFESSDSQTMKFEPPASQVEVVEYPQRPEPVLPISSQQLDSHDGSEVRRLESIIVERDVTIENLMKKVADLEYQLEHTTPFPFPPPRKPSIARDRDPTPVSLLATDNPPAASRSHSARRGSELKSRTRTASLYSASSRKVSKPTLPPVNREVGDIAVRNTQSQGRSVAMSPPTQEYPSCNVPTDVPPPVVVNTSLPMESERPPTDKPMSIIEIRRMKMGMMNQPVAAPTRRFG